MLAIELRPLVGAEHFGGRDLQHDRLGRDLYGRHRDLVVRPDILERLDVGIAADQRHRLRRGGDDALDAAAGAIPQQQQIAGAGVEDIDAAGQQRVGLRAAAGEGHPFGGDAGHAERGGVLFDQLLLLDDVRSACRRCRAAATARSRSSAAPSAGEPDSAQRQRPRRTAARIRHIILFMYFLRPARHLTRLAEMH